ncbi:MAG: metallophosphoesterase [Bryobacterales bacterium]|nr:metallophosphoesterase [Bryobacterales bacterium]
MDFLRRHFVELLAAPLLVWVQWLWVRRLITAFPSVPPSWLRAGGMAALALVGFGVAMSLPGSNRLFGYAPPVEWLKAAGLGWGAISGAAWVIDWVWRRWLQPRPAVQGRRQLLLQAGRAAATGAPALALGYGTFLERYRFRAVEQRIKVKGLPKDLDGVRLAQITDIHFGAFFTRRDLDYAVDMANAANPHLTLVTGDFISVHSDPLEECLERLRRLRASAGVWGCLGNHEIVARCEDYATLRASEQGLRILRGERAPVQIGNATLNLAGVDYQPKHRPYLKAAAALVQPGQFNVLLSHNPDVFGVAAAQGWDLTVAGHTHGGQINVEILGMSANVARFYTPYVYGHYQKEGRQIYVSRGLGTVGLPSRIGAPPEVSLLTLCAT